VSETGSKAQQALYGGTHWEASEEKSLRLVSSSCSRLEEGIGEDNGEEDDE
jgi:hypothetical protein